MAARWACARCHTLIYGHQHASDSPAVLLLFASRYSSLFRVEFLFSSCFPLTVSPGRRSTGCGCLSEEGALWRAGLDRSGTGRLADTSKRELLLISQKAHHWRARLGLYVTSCRSEWSAGLVTNQQAQRDRSAVLLMFPGTLRTGGKETDR